MTDCVQMLKDWKRMCNAMTAMDGCEDCPIVKNTHGARCGDMPCEMQDIESIAREIEKWAAEHPEPQYPTWYEYLTDMYPVAWNMIKDKPIPADIAQKLGIEPEEG
jgi:hypothetical protein